MSNVDYGPLSPLLGSWRGNKGVDVSPRHPNGADENAYTETLLFEAAGEVENAEEQVLSVLRYHQVVTRVSDNKVFHNESGYWMWDPATELVMQSLAIPRGVCLLAGGSAARASNGTTTITVRAALDDEQWQIVQSPFMREKARTLSFAHELVRAGDELRYHETTLLDIYGQRFEHTDHNVLEQS